MDDKFQTILDGLPETPPRSRLEPLREFIDELRRSRRTYREIARILAEHCKIPVSVSTVHRFLHSRPRTRPQPRNRLAPRVAEMTKLSPSAVAVEKIQTDSGTPSPTADEIQQRIAALKLRQAPAQTKSKLFHYDPNEPLRLQPRSGK